jgi:arylsulfatase
MEMTGAVYPKQLNGRKLKSPAGTSLLPIFEEKQRKGHDVLFWQFNKAKAVRTGKWKLVRLGQADWQLYDLEKDRTELNNLARQYPQKVKQMAAMWEDWWEKCKKKV